MRIARAEFWAAAARPREIPAAVRPEIAVAGRSNVGKSSLINRLAGRKKLARTSGTPGCTRGLNFFDLDGRLTIVDLPGYGWAKRSKAEKAGWSRLVEHYLENREALAGVLVLIDVRRGTGQEERTLAAYLESHQIPFAWVLTKCDKLKRTQLGVRLGELEEELGVVGTIATSVRTGVGMEEVWSWMRAAVGALGGYSV